MVVLVVSATFFLIILVALSLMLVKLLHGGVGQVVLLLLHKCVCLLELLLLLTRLLRGLELLIGWLLVLVARQGNVGGLELLLRWLDARVGVHVLLHLLLLMHLEGVNLLHESFIATLS